LPPVSPLSLLSASRLSAEPASPGPQAQEICSRITCAFNLRIVLKQKDGSTFDKSFPALPQVQPAGVSVYPGQSILFEADMEGDRLANFRLVTSAEHPEKTISATLQQLDDGAMVLKLKNPFRRHLPVKMAMMPLGLEKLLNTSSCPVLSDGRVSFEMWPHPIFQIWLGEFRLLDDSSDMACSE